MSGFDSEALAISVLSVEVRESSLDLLRFVFRVQDDHESGDWSQDGRVFCRACGSPTEYPCEYRQWADKVERTAPPAVMEDWRTRLLRSLQ